MTENMSDPKVMLNLLMDVGGELISCNSEIRRVEDTIRRIGLAYGAVEMDVFVITSLIVVTMVLPDGSRLTQSRRINVVPAFNFEKMQALNALSREYCSKPFAKIELKQRFEEIKNGTTASKKRDFLLDYLGCAVIGGVFPIFFGGNLLDGLVGMLCGIIVGSIQNFVKKLAPNQLVLQLVVAFVIGCVIKLFGTFFPVLHVDKIMIGDIMLLIPGVAMTNAVKDVLTGDTLAGILRLVETIIWAAALAIGFMVSMSMVFSW